MREQTEITDGPKPWRANGPTLDEYVEAGYKAENYPPQGYLPREDKMKSNLVDHKFSETTQVRDNVFFAGETKIPRHLLEAHKRDKANQERLQREAQLRENMSADEISSRELALSAGGAAVGEGEEERTGVIPDFTPAPAAGIKEDGNGEDGDKDE